MPVQYDRVEADPDTRLGQLLSLWDAVKAAADESQARFDELKEAVKAEGTAAMPDSENIMLLSASLQKPLVLSHKTPWRIAEKRLKEENPTLYVKYAVKQNFWDLRRAR